MLYTSEISIAVMYLLSVPSGSLTFTNISDLLDSAEPATDLQHFIGIQPNAFVSEVIRRSTLQNIVVLPMASTLVPYRLACNSTAPLTEGGLNIIDTIKYAGPLTRTNSKILRFSHM
jgi:hypothetical protein